jgi:hypothetical protein
MRESHSYRHLTQETNEDTTSSYSDHQQLQGRRPKQLPYMKATGTNLNTTSEQGSHTSGSNIPTSTNLTERVSHQTTNKYPTHQMKNQQCQDHSQKTPVTTTNQRSVTHQQLIKNLHHQQHQTPVTHTMEENPESYHHQTHTTLASLLLAKNNNQSQQIWRLRLLQLQQQ